MNKNILMRYSFFLIFLFGNIMLSYSQNNFKRNYMGIQAGMIISKGTGQGNSLSYASKNSFIVGEQIGVTYKYFSKSRFMFGADLNVSRTGNENISKYNSAVVANDSGYDVIEVTNKDIYHCIDLPQYLGYSPVKSHNFCLSVYGGIMPRVLLSETDYRTSNDSSLNFDKFIKIEKHIVVDALIGASLDFKLSERLALELSPKYSYGFSKQVNLHNLYIPLSLIISLK
jgi:hypothetical protein